MDVRKLTLWHTIDWYASSIGTEHESHERKVLDQAIDAALAATADRDMICETHPWLPWPHGKCGGPGCPVDAKDVLFRDRISGLQQAVEQRETMIADLYHAATADAPPKVPLESVLKQDKVIEIDENGKVHLPPPSDAAPVAWREWSCIAPMCNAVWYGASETVFCRCPGCGTIHLDDPRDYAHPDDAPRPDKASEDTTGGERPEQVEDALPRTKDFHPDDRATDPEDALGGPWEELLVAGTLYISALKYLIEGYRGNDGWERIMAIRDSVNVQEERWTKAVDRLKGEKDG